MATDDRPERPVCPCHGWGGCVHFIGGKLDLTTLDPIGGIDWDEMWQWHCLAEPCDNYSVRLLHPADGWRGEKTYGEMVNAPLSMQDIEEINRRIADGTMPRRTIKVDPE